MQEISYTMQGASKASGLSVRMLYRLIGEKQLKSSTVGRRRLVDARSLSDLVLGRRSSSVAAEDLAEAVAVQNPPSTSRGRRRRG